MVSVYRTFGKLVEMDLDAHTRMITVTVRRHYFMHEKRVVSAREMSNKMGRESAESSRPDTKWEVLIKLTMAAEENHKDPEARRALRAWLAQNDPYGELKVVRKRDSRDSRDSRCASKPT